MKRERIKKLLVVIKKNVQRPLLKNNWEMKCLEEKQKRNGFRELVRTYTNGYWLLENNIQIFGGVLSDWKKLMMFKQ